MTQRLERRLTLPPTAVLAAACAGVIGEWHRLEPPLEWDAAVAGFPHTEDWLGGVSRLALINCFQWHLEDECRARYDETARLAALKHDIDDSNARRVASIDAIDEQLARELAGVSVDRNEPVALVTPGNLLDRISILELKRYHAAPGGHAAAIVLEQLGDACDGLERLVADLASGRQRMKLYRTIKLYGTSD